MVQHLLGPILWDGIYAGKKDAITDESAVPRQVHIMLKMCMSKLELEFKKSKEIEAVNQATCQEARTTNLARAANGNQQH